jgi:hypothetical protein
MFIRRRRDMPFKSKSQQRYMFKFLPKIAKRWAKETKNIKKLPNKVRRRKKNG